MWPAIRKQQYLRRWLMSDNDMFEKVQRLYIEKYQSKNTVPIPRKSFLRPVGMKKCSCGIIQSVRNCIFRS